MPDEQHARLVAADQRFQAALAQAIAAGDERIEAVQATVQLKRRTSCPCEAPVWLVPTDSGCDSAGACKKRNQQEAHQELPCGTSVSFDQLVERTT